MIYTDNELISFLNRYISNQMIISPLKYECDKKNIGPFLLVYQIVGIDRFIDIMKSVNFNDEHINNMNLIFDYKNLVNNGKIFIDDYYQVLIDTFFNKFSHNDMQDFYEINGWKKLKDCFKYLELSSIYLEEIEKTQFQKILSYLNINDIAKFFKKLYERKIEYNQNYLSDNFSVLNFAILEKIYNETNSFKDKLLDLLSLIDDVLKYVPFDTKHKDLLMNMKYKIEADLTIIKMATISNTPILKTVDPFIHTTQYHISNIMSSVNWQTVNKLVTHSLAQENQNYDKFNR